jgi:glycosyltransferase involved in cell wall biosynthesis
MDTKPVSIILPCYNSGRHLKYAIESILNNTSYPFELILIESESTDGTDKVCDKYAKEWANVKVYHTKKEGFVKAMNFGIKMAGENDVYLTQDDVILPKLYERDWLEILVKGSKNEKCGIVSTFFAGGRSGNDYIDGLNWVGTWSCFIPRSTINQIGYFDENFNPGCGDDIDYSYRIFLAGLRIYIVDFWVDHHRQTEHFQDNEKLMKEHAEYFRKKYGLSEYAKK